MMKQSYKRKNPLKNMKNRHVTLRSFIPCTAKQKFQKPSKSTPKSLKTAKHVVKISKSTPLIILLVIILIALNVFNVYYLSDIIRAGLDTQLQYILFFVQGGILILLGFAAFMYNERFQGKTPLIYLYMVLCFVLSDCFGLAAYFYEAQAAYFPERIFYLLGIVFLVNFALNTKKQKEEGKSLAEKEYIL